MLHDAAQALSASLSPDPPAIQIQRRDDIVFVDLLTPELIGDDAIERMADEVAGVIAAEQMPRVVMNFEHVRHISSTMLGTLITLRNRVEARGGQMRLAALRGRHKRLLRVTHLDTLFEVHATAEQAAASLR